MTSWAPEREDVRAESSGRTFTDTDVDRAITSAVLDVRGEVGNFDATAVIVEADPDTGTTEVTVGDLAKLAAATRAAHLLEGGFPEQNPYGEPTASHASRLYARWRDRLARLQRWIGSSTDTPQDPEVWSGSVGIALPIHRIETTG